MLKGISWSITIRWNFLQSVLHFLKGECLCLFCAAVTEYHTLGIKKQKFISHGSRGQEVQDQGRCACLVRAATSIGEDHHVLPWQRKATGNLFYKRALVLFMREVLSWPHCLLRDHTSNTGILEGTYYSNPSSSVGINWMKHWQECLRMFYAKSFTELSAVLAMVATEHLKYV